jgi:hypothetical protein
MPQAPAFGQFLELQQIRSQVLVVIANARQKELSDDSKSII